MMYRTKWLVLSALIVAVSGGSAKAWAEPVAPEGQAPSISDVLPKRGSEEAIARGKAAMARARELYSNLKTYSDSSVVRKHQDYSDRESTGVTGSEFVCERPGRFRVDFNRTSIYGPMAMVSDGTRYRRSVTESEVYTDDDAPDISAPIVFKNDIVADNLPPHFYLVARGTTVPELLLRTPREVIDSREEVLDGQKGLRVVCLAVAEQDWEKPDAKADIVHEFWLEEKSGAIGQMVRDWTVRTRESDKDRQPDLKTDEAPHVAKRIATVTRMTNIRIDQPVAPNTFVFATQPEWKKVPEFITNSGYDSGQYKTLGLPAPQFKLMDLTGKEVALADLSGRVVLLDFWATWCGPCVSAMPHLQKLQEEFKDRPVTILALNSDYAMSDEKLAAWMAKRKFTFGTLRLVEGGSTFQDFGVGGIPHTVLIDTKGIVQDVTVGFMGDEHGTVLKDRISRLLAGESLKTPEEFKSIRENGQKRRVPNVSYVRSVGEYAPVEEVNPDQITAWSKTVQGAMPYTARAVQLAGGAMGVASPLTQRESAGFVLYEPKGDKVTSFVAEGAKGNTYSWTTLLDGGLKFAAIFMDHDQRSYAQIPGPLTCWDSAGKKLWSLDLELPRQVSGEMKLESGDLDGDDRPEIVVLISVEELTTRGAGRTSNGKTLAKVCVISAEGKLLAVKHLPLFINTSLSILTQPGEKPTIVAFGGGKVWRLLFDGGRGSLTERESTVGSAEASR